MDTLTRWATSRWGLRLARAGLGFLMVFCGIIGRALWSTSAEFAHDVPRLAYLRWPLMLLLWGALACLIAALLRVFRFLGRVRHEAADGPALATWLLRCCVVATLLVGAVFVLVCTTPGDRYLVFMVLTFTATVFCGTCVLLAGIARELLLRRSRG